MKKATRATSKAPAASKPTTTIPAQAVIQTLRDPVPGERVIVVKQSKTASTLLDWHGRLCRVTGGLVTVYARQSITKREIRQWADSTQQVVDEMRKMLGEDDKSALQKAIDSGHSDDM